MGMEHSCGLLWLQPAHEDGKPGSFLEAPSGQDRVDRVLDYLEKSGA